MPRLQKRKSLSTTSTTKTTLSEICKRDLLTAGEIKNNTSLGCYFLLPLVWTDHCNFLSQNKKQPNFTCKTSNVSPSWSHTAGWGSGWACRWPRHRGRNTPDTTAASMMCCSVKTKQNTDMKHCWGQTWFITAKKKKEKKNTPLCSIIIPAHPHVIFM